MWNPLSWVMEAVAVMEIALANGGSQGPDWEDFMGIVCLLLINSTISFIEENNAGNAAAALMARLAPKTKVLRDGKWQEQDASILVPGDIISIKLGDIIPADARLLEGDALKIDQSALTGESLPVTKKTGDFVFSGSTCKLGEIEAVVIATGVHTFFGKSAQLVESTEVTGHLQKVIVTCSWITLMYLQIDEHVQRLNVRLEKCLGYPTSICFSLMYLFLMVLLHFALGRTQLLLTLLQLRRGGLYCKDCWQ